MFLKIMIKNQFSNTKEIDFFFDMHIEDFRKKQIQIQHLSYKKIKDNGITIIYITIDLKSSHIGYLGNETKINERKKYINSYKNEYNTIIILIDGRSIV